MDLIVEPFLDRSGARGLFVLLERTFHFYTESKTIAAQLMSLHAQRVVCFDSRRLLEAFPELRDLSIYDVKLIYGGEGSLYHVCRSNLEGGVLQDLKDSERELSIHMRACRTAKVDESRNSLLRLVPLRVFEKYGRSVVSAVEALWQKKATSDLSSYEEDTWPFAVALYDVERNGIAVDEAFVKESLKSSGLTSAEAGALRSIQGLVRDGKVYSKFSPVGGKTGRIRVEGGFNSMAIPHGVPRKAIVSRFECGSICAFDFNAIDYRCIVGSVPDKSFRTLYEDCPDFHTRTASFLFGDNVDELKRDVIKKITYVYIYGGSEETLVQKTGLSLERLRDVLARLDQKMTPIREFREELCSRSKRQGYVELPHGRRIPVTRDDHDGKVLGLYAQGFSSVVFQNAFMKVQRNTSGILSKTIFTVHDELVMDIHPDETQWVPSIKKLMEGPHGKFVVNYKQGRNYHEATD